MSAPEHPKQPDQPRPANAPPPGPGPGTGTTQEEEPVYDAEVRPTEGPEN